MARPSIGQLPQRYSFLLNPYIDTRLSKCPHYEKPTHLRKFALFIHIDQWGPMGGGNNDNGLSLLVLILMIGIILK